MVLNPLGTAGAEPVGKDDADETLRPVGRPGAVGMEAMVMVMGTTGPGAVGMDAVVDEVELVPLMGKAGPVSG